MMPKEIYLLPIWIEITSKEPIETLKEINELLGVCLEDFAQSYTEKHKCEIGVEWSVTKHIGGEIK